MKTILLNCFLFLTVIASAQTAQNDMFRVEAYGTLITITPLKCATLDIDGAVGSKLYDTSFTISGTTTFTVSQAIIGQELRFRTMTKCGDNSNSSWVSFKVIQPLVFPVKVVHFSAVPGQASVAVFYHIEVTEGDHFEIERSADGVRFAPIFYSTIGTQNPYTGKRSLIDHEPYGLNFYRVKMYEGFKVSYSNTVMVKMPSKNLNSVNIFTTGGQYMGKVKYSNIERELKALPVGVYAIPETGEKKSNF